LFNELLSSVNRLSVNERVRLIKSLAGQHGLVVQTPAALVRATGTSGAARDQGDVERKKRQQRPNPLRGTAPFQELEEARNALRVEKERLMTKVLPKDNLVFRQYEAALASYTVAKERVDPAYRPKGGAQEHASYGTKRIHLATTSSTDNIGDDMDEVGDEDSSSPEPPKRPSREGKTILSRITGGKPGKKN
jgi:hypothetical protein